MALVIDTSALIQMERSGGGAAGLRQETGNSAAFVPVIVWAELLAGVHLADTVERALARRSRIERLRRSVGTLEFTEAVAETWARLFAHLQRQGTPIPSNDLQVAAIAAFHRYTILVGPADEAHFRRIPDLDIRVWK